MRISDLQSRTVINLLDGKNVGNIIDFEINDEGSVIGFVVEKYKFLKNTKKIELTIFILFFIPGTPKDALTYLAPFVPIKPKKFFVISTIARIPSVITSTILGDQIIKGNYLIAIIVFVITAIISIGGILFNNYYTKRKQNENELKQ